MEYVGECKVLPQPPSALEFRTNLVIAVELAICHMTLQ